MKRLHTLNGENKRLKKRYIIEDKVGNYVKTGMFTEPEVRMAAKAGLRIFDAEKSKAEITQELTGLFDSRYKNRNNGGIN